ncbi:MAG TPA: hypothetical protein VFL76_10575 [Edaphocola sp.]|nr:hypothetical protein [Edaphocola sp.]
MSIIHQEGKLAEAIEEQTAKLPPDTFLWSAAASMALSMGLKCINKKHLAQMAGQWTAPLLLFGIYNKIVKTMGHH